MKLIRFDLDIEGMDTLVEAVVEITPEVEGVHTGHPDNRTPDEPADVFIEELRLVLTDANITVDISGLLYDEYILETVQDAVLDALNNEE